MNVAGRLGRLEQRAELGAQAYVVEADTTLSMAETLRQLGIRAGPTDLVIMLSGEPGSPPQILASGPIGDRQTAVRNLGRAISSERMDFGAPLDLVARLQAGRRRVMEAAQ